MSSLVDALELMDSWTSTFFQALHPGYAHKVRQTRAATAELIAVSALIAAHYNYPAGRKTPADLWQRFYAALAACGVKP